MGNIYQFIEKYIGFSAETANKIVLSVVVILILIVIRFILLTIVNRLKNSAKSKFHIRNTVSYFIVFIIIISLFRIWFTGFGSLATYLGLVSAGIAIALKDPLVDMAAWVFIVIWRPFEVGDRIEIGKIKGDVVNTNLFQFTLNEVGQWVDYEQSTGRIIHIPNSKVFTESQANYTQEFPYIWNEIDVMVTFESDWKKAKKILNRLINAHCESTVNEAEAAIKRSSKRNLIYFGKLTPIVWTDVQDSGVLLSMRYLCSPYHKRSSQSELWEAILDEFDTFEDIDLAYPTIRQYRI